MFLNPYTDDGLNPLHADLERRYLMAATCHRVGRSKAVMPRQLVEQQVRRRRGGNTRPNRGIAHHKASGKWQAYVVLPSGRRRSLGYHPNKEEAERAVSHYRAAVASSANK